MKQIVRTYWGDFPQRDLAIDMEAHPNWVIQTMTVIPKDKDHMNQLIVVFNEERPVLPVTEPLDIDDPWDWKKKTPKVGDWPPGPTPTCKGE